MEVSITQIENRTLKNNIYAFMPFKDLMSSGIEFKVF